MKLQKGLSESRTKIFQNQEMRYTMLKLKFQALSDWILNFKYNNCLKAL